MKKLILIIIALAAFCFEGRSWCFAHKVAAHIAMQHLTPQTKSALDYYFDGSIVEYSLWMDRYRYEPVVWAQNRGHSGACNEDYSCNTSIDVPGKENIEPYIIKTTDLLKNYKELPDSVVRTELKFLIHSVGDMHCPVHIKGYNIPNKNVKLVYEGKSMTYHALWDVALERMYPELKLKVGLFTKKIDYGVTDEMAQSMIQGNALDWGKERNILCKDLYAWIKPGDVIDKTYFDQHGHLADEMVLKAGYRLAHLLNLIFDENYSK